MRRGYVLLAAALAMVLAPGAGWGDFEVLRDFEDETTMDDYWGTTDNGVSTDTPDAASSYSNSVTLAWEFSEGGMSLLYDPVEDFSGWSFLNFYIKFEGEAAEGWVDAPNAGWADGNYWDLFPPFPTDWTYYSLDLSDPDGGWFSGHDWTETAAINLGWYDGEEPALTVFIDHITVSDTSDEGLVDYVPPAPLVFVFISGPHLVTEGQEVTLVGNVVGGEGTDCEWTKDGGAPVAGMELDLGAVTGADEGVYVFECTVDDEATPSEDFDLIVVDAVPLAGGLGLGLLAGACALAGAVTIRRKK